MIGRSDADDETLLNMIGGSDADDETLLNMIGRSDADDETFRTHQTVWVPLDRLTRHTQHLHLSLIHGQ